MSTNRNLEDIVKKINKIVGCEDILICSTNDNLLNLTDIHEEVCTFITDENIHTVFLNNRHILRDDMKKLILYTLNTFAHLKGYVVSKEKEKIINKLINVKLSEVEITNLLSHLGLNSSKKISILVIKYNDQSQSDNIISIIENLDNKCTVVKTKLDEIMVIIKKNVVEKDIFIKNIVDIIETELFASVKVGVSKNLKASKISKAYKQGLKSLQLARLFNLKGRVFNYDSLKIYKILSCISNSCFNELILEIDDCDLDKLDNEQIKTANVFIENDLNVSETARQLYIHRNTLLYRLEKIRRVTEFDLKIFSDAVEFKLLLLIRNMIENKK